MPKSIDADFILDSTGNLSIVDNLESLRQKIERKLQLFQGEWELDINAGIPYLQEIFERPISAGLAASIINRQILNEQEVTGLGTVSADLDAATRSFTYEAEVNTIYGTTKVTNGNG